VHHTVPQSVLYIIPIHSKIYTVDASLRQSDGFQIYNQHAAIDTIKVVHQLCGDIRSAIRRYQLLSTTSRRLQRPDGACMSHVVLMQEVHRNSDLKTRCVQKEPPAQCEARTLGEQSWLSRKLNQKTDA